MNTIPTTSVRPGAGRDLARYKRAERLRPRNATGIYIRGRDKMSRGGRIGAGRWFLDLCGDLRTAVSVLNEIERQR